MDQFHHEYIDILKIDIEGDELEVFAEFFKTRDERMREKYSHPAIDEHPIAGLILAELHYPVLDKYSANFDESALHAWADFFLLLEEHGYAVYHKEINPYDLKCYEYAFVHLKQMEKLEREYYQRLITND